MGLDLVPTGKNPPDEINVVIEIPKDAEPVKYEVDKASGAIFVDRILSTPMRYPCNYGYIPRTLCGDGDPADVLVILPLPLIPGSVIRCRPVGMRKMKDEAGEDWIVYHAIDVDRPRQRQEDEINSRRVLLIDRIQWRDGWPHVGTPSDGPQPRPMA